MEMGSLRARSSRPASSISPVPTAAAQPAGDRTNLACRVPIPAPGPSAPAASNLVSWRPAVPSSAVASKGLRRSCRNHRHRRERRLPRALRWKNLSRQRSDVVWLDGNGDQSPEKISGSACNADLASVCDRLENRNVSGEERSRQECDDEIPAALIMAGAAGPRSLRGLEVGHDRRRTRLERLFHHLPARFESAGT